MSFGFLAAAMAAGPAVAQSSVRWCADQTESAASERIAACSTLLKSRISGKPAGVAYALRGLAYLDRGDIPNGIADLDKAVELAPDFAPAYQNRGNGWYARGNFGRAIADYDMAIKLDPNTASAYANRATVRRDVGYTDGAVEDYAKAISLDPRNARPYASRGQLYLQQHNYSRAVADFEQAVRLSPNEPNFMLLGKAQLGAGDFSRALYAYAEAARLEPQDVGPINAQATVYARKGEFDKALALYDRALHIDPNAPATYRARAEAYYAKGDHKRALKEIDRVLKFTWTVDALKLRAQWRLADGDLIGASSDVDHIDKIDPDGSSSAMLRGAVAARKKDYATALSTFNKVLIENPNDAFALSERGLLYAAKADEGRALPDLNRAIELGAGNAALYRERGKIYRDKSDAAKALADFDQAIARDPSPAWVYFDRAKLRKAKGDVGGELTDLNEGLKRAPDNALALYERGLIRNGKGDSAGAIADFDSALKIEPKNTTFLKSRAMARAAGKSKDVTQLIADLDALIAVDPHNALNYYQRGLAYERAQEADKAAADFRLALAKDRKLMDAKRALDRLAAESRHWKKKPAMKEAAIDPRKAESKSEPKRYVKPESKLENNSAAAAPSVDAPPDAALADVKPEQTASIPTPPAALVTKSAVRSNTESKTTAKPAKTNEVASRPRYQDRRSERVTHVATKSTTQHFVGKDMRHTTQTRTVEVRRPQVRYYYVERRRPARFTDLFQ